VEINEMTIDRQNRSNGFFIARSELFLAAFCVTKVRDLVCVSSAAKYYSQLLVSVNIMKI
jgi:hypothetical protein